MIRIQPLPKPKKPASAAPALRLKPSCGRTPLSRWLRSGGALKPVARNER